MADRILPSWREGATRSRIIGFLDQVDDIPPNDCVAVFDNDGTMWCEKPDYTQIEFLLRELRQAVEADAGLRKREEYRAVLDGDRAALGELGLERVVMAPVDLHTGLTPEAFNARVGTFFAEARHPERGVAYRQQRYQPMLELMDELRTRGFDFYIVTGGGSEFVRVIARDLYGVAPEGVVGSQVAYEVAASDDGSLGLLRTNQVVGTGVNEGLVKVTNIQRILGRRPIVAGSNSVGDAEMLRFAMSYDGPSLSLVVDHDDDQREYAYESTAGTFYTEETDPGDGSPPRVGCGEHPE